MARAETASASLRSDSIKGMAQSIANPAYRRLVTAEPVLRRAVPVLIVAFMLTICIGAGVQVLDHRRQVIFDSIRTSEALADHLAAAFDRTARDGKPQLPRSSDLLARALPAWAAGAGRSILIADVNGAIIASAPNAPTLQGRNILDVLGTTQPLPTATTAGTTESLLPDGDAVFATMRALRSPIGFLAVVQPRSEALASWRSTTALTVTLSATTGFVVLILGFAFHWQATRAREADVIHDTVRYRIDTALNRGRCGLWDWDLARGRVFWSHSMFDILGLPPKDDLLTFGEVSALVHKDDIDLYALAKEVADSKVQSIDHAFRMRHADGRWLWLRARCELMRQEGEGGGLHLIGIAVDITEQKNLVERTVAADLRLRDAIETIPEAFVLWDADNRLVLCNSNFQQLHHLPDEAVQSGARYESVVAAGKKPILRTTISNDDREPPGAGTFEVQLDDGRWMHISERRTKDGGYVSVGTDITKIKLHEQKLVEGERRQAATINDLRKSQEALQLQTDQLADLAEKYAEEKTRAEDANAAKSKFLANMSHELRTPLNAIIGFSEIMEAAMFGPLGTEKYCEYSRDIRESGQYLLDVINDILDMSKIEAGGIHLAPEEVDLDSIIADCQRVVLGRANEKHLSLTSHIDPAIRFKADRRAVKQIGLNLLSNAVKFTPDGGAVTVRGHVRAGKVTIAIEDTGIGIPKDALHKLGRPFEQVESQLTKRYQGSGLGLAIAKSLTELHGGAMRIHSRLGRGTTVVVRLPLEARPQQRHVDAAA
jgi:two-component system, cell cycle sensor histidine kinase PleC